MQITPDNTADFLRRHYSFHDCLLRRFEYVYRGRMPYDAHARVTLSVQYIPETAPPEVQARKYVPSNGGPEEWCNLVLDFEDVTEFVWAEGGDVFQQVLLFHMHIRHWNNQVFVDFGGLEYWIADELTTPENGLEAFRKSKVYIAARSVSWTRLPYAEL